MGRDYFAGLLTQAVDRLGDGHRDVLLIRHQIAWWTGGAGGVQEAAAAYQELVAAFASLLEADHPVVLNIRGLRAYWRAEAGAVEVDALRALVQDMTLGRAASRTRRICALGLDHADVLAVRALLAQALGRGGDPPAAANTYRDVADAARVLVGADSAVVQIAEDQHAYWAGRLGGAPLAGGTP